MNALAIPHDRQSWERLAGELRPEGRALIAGRLQAAQDGRVFQDVSPIDGSLICEVARVEVGVEPRVYPRWRAHRLLHVVGLLEQQLPQAFEGGAVLGNSGGRQLQPLSAWRPAMSRLSSVIECRFKSARIVSYSSGSTGSRRRSRTALMSR